MIGEQKIGEVFLCGPDTKGVLEPMEYFLGRPISGLGGGGMKIFVMEEGDAREGLVSSLHSPQYDLNVQTMLESQRARGNIPTSSIGEAEEEEVVDQGVDLNIDTEGPLIGEEVEIGVGVEKELGDIERPLREGNDDSRADLHSTFRGTQSMESVHENLGYLRQIAAGKQHILHLTEDGLVYSYGSGMYGVSGHGGSYWNLQPQLIRSLTLTQTYLMEPEKRRIVQIACGEYHSMVLNAGGDIYVWGRGFEGQLGIPRAKVISKPKHIEYFLKREKKVGYIAAGANYSLAVLREGTLYGWGEAKLGQLGIGKRRQLDTPDIIHIYEQEEDVMRKTKSQISIRQDQMEPIRDPARVIKCAAGLGHTAALTDLGDVFVWGFNIYGQLGLGDRKTRWFPTRVERDVIGNNLAKAAHVSCGYYSTFIIDLNGRVFSWGRGYIGHKELTLEDLPRRIEANSENRIFTAVLCNEQTTILYAPTRVYSISPKCGPASGGTIMSILGTGFRDTEHMKVHFTYGDQKNHVKEVPCDFDPKLKCLTCTTPKFEDTSEGDQHEEINFPQIVKVAITLDGVHYSYCEEDFLVYSGGIKINTINPKSGPVSGGTSLKVTIDIDPETVKWLFHLTVGFQARKVKVPTRINLGILRAVNSVQRGSGGESSSKHGIAGDRGETVEREKSSRGMQRLMSARNRQMSGVSHENSTMYGGGKTINPLEPFEESLDLDNWYCAVGYYTNGRISCRVPPVFDFDPEGLQYNVDIALNGQQFTGSPVIFRYFDLQIHSAEPSMGMSEGGTIIKIKGTGLYDSQGKKFKFQTEYGEREVPATWDRKEKSMSCIVPPLTWLFGGATPTPQMIDTVLSSAATVMFTLNSQQWSQAINFKYLDPLFERMSYELEFGEGLSPQEKEEEWAKEEPMVVPPIDPAELEKWEEEKEKTMKEEEEEIGTISRRTGTKFYIWGKKFIKTDCVCVRFTYEGKHVINDAVFKNETKIGCALPDIEDLPMGDHKLIVDLSFNGQQFTNSGKAILYKAIDKNISEAELKKLEEAEMKARKSKQPAKGVKGKK